MSFREKAYGLKEKRPFYPQIPSIKDLPTWVDREQELDLVDKALETARQGKATNLIFVVGDYGLGKTMMLLKILDVARETAGSRVLTFHTNFISPQKISNPGVNIVLKIMRGIVQAKPKLKLTQPITKKLSQLHPDVLNLFEAAFGGNSDATRKQVALDFLGGALKPSQPQMRNLNIIRKLDTIEVSLEYFVGLLFLLKQSGIEMVVGVMDEFEYLFRLTSKAQQPIYLAVLRELYDMPSKWPPEWFEDSAAMALFFGISDDGQRYFLELGQVEGTTGGPITPLKDRISYIFLRPFDRASTELVIKKRLSLNRITGRYHGNPLIPFTEDYVDYVFKVSEGRPRWIIRDCDHVLDAGLGRKVRVLDARFARSVLQEKGLAGEAESQEQKAIT